MQPEFAAVTGDRLGSADLGDVLLARPGSNILKPRFGSNGVGVARIVSDGDRLTAASDCPETAHYLEEFPADPRRHGRNVIAATATRGAVLELATAMLPGVGDGAVDPGRWDIVRTGSMGRSSSPGS